MSSIVFELNLDDKKENQNKKGSTATFHFDNIFTGKRCCRKIRFDIDEKKGHFYKDDLKPYTDFLISKGILNDASLTLCQDKLIKYMIFGYPKSYPHSRIEYSGIGKYFNKRNFDRYCLADYVNMSERPYLTPPQSDSSSVYPKRLLAPQESGTTTLILGSSFTGKTYLLSQEINLLRPFEYDLIVLFTESIHVPALDKIRNRPDILIKEGFDSAIPQFLKALNSRLGLRYRFLLILDDIISEKSNRKSTLGKMLTTYRNSNISTCVLAQYPTIISKESRSNFHQLVLTGMRSPESNKAFADRFDVMSWAKDRMLKSQDWNGKGRITSDDVYNYLKRLLMENGIVMYIDLKRSKDPSVINLQ